MQTDRGGQVTYHGPGQITGYLMFDLRRLKIGVRDLVTNIEASMVATVGAYNIDAAPRADAPGVYINSDKIGSLGLRVRKGLFLSRLEPQCRYGSRAFFENQSL